MNKNKIDSVVNTLLENCKLYQDNRTFSKALVSGLSVKELKKIERQAIANYKKSRDFDALKEECEAKGKIMFADDLFKSLTGKQRDDIINVEVGESDRDNWTTQEWWDGMSITERKEAFIRITQLNA